MTYELDLTADECYGVGAAPKILYDGDKDTYQNMSGNPGNAGIFCIDKSAIGSIWTATVRYINSLYITTYKDFKSAKLIPGISDMRGYELGKGYDSNITITEEMKYVSIWSGSGSFSSSEVYKVEE